MNKELLNFFEKLSDQTSLVDRIAVTLFLDFNNIGVQKNSFIKSLCISETEVEIYKNYCDVKNLACNTDRITLTDLIHIFEKSVPDKDKIINGVVYTPDFIKEFIVENTLQEIQTNPLHVIGGDIACGCGGFLITLAKTIKIKTDKSYFEIFRQNLFGLDITHYSIERTKILLTLLAISEGEEEENFEFNLFIGNALDFNWFGNVPQIKNNGGFDLIVGNPPYVTKRNMDDETKKLLDKWPATQIGNTDLYIPFFEIGLKFLSEKGCLGYITVNSFFRSLNARLLRQLFQINKNYLKIIDFGDEPLFGSRSTYSCICLIKKEKSENILTVKVTSRELKSTDKLNFEPIPYRELDWERGWLLTNGQISINLNKIENTGTPLGKKYNIKGGFATLKNDIFVFQPVKEDERYYFREFKGDEVAIEKEICKIALNPNRIKTEREIATKGERIIFPYKRMGKRVELIEEENFKLSFPRAFDFLLRNRDILHDRDKGKGINYDAWYQYGRNQSLADRGIRLLYPHICKEPHFILTEIGDLLFYNGNAIYSDSKKELQVLKKILGSDVFKYYLKYSSRNYSGNYISLSKNYIKHFGVCDLKDDESNYLLSLTNQDEINSFLIKKYGLNQVDQIKISA